MVLYPLSPLVLIYGPIRTSHVAAGCGQIPPVCRESVHALSGIPELVLFQRGQNTAISVLAYSALHTRVQFIGVAYTSSKLPKQNR